MKKLVNNLEEYKNVVLSNYRNTIENEKFSYLDTDVELEWEHITKSGFIPEQYPCVAIVDHSYITETKEIITYVDYVYLNDFN